MTTEQNVTVATENNMTPEEKKKLLLDQSFSNTEELGADSQPRGLRSLAVPEGQTASSMLGRGVRKIGGPLVAGLAGTAIDTAALIPRALERVGNNMYRGFTGQPADTSPFVMNATTQSFLNDNKTTSLKDIPGQVFAADPNEISREKQRIQSRLSQLSDQPIDQPQKPVSQTNNSKPATDNTSSINIQKPAQSNFLYAEDTERMNRLGGIKEMLRSPNPDINYSMLRDEKTGKSVVRETINGSGNNSAPALERPFVSAKKFRQIIGWDKDRNPIYSTGVDEMNAANAGIASYNAEQMNGYNNRNNAWASENGTVPLQNAQTSEAIAHANEIPLTGKSLRDYQAAQIKNLGTGTGVDKDNFLKIVNQVPSGEIDLATGMQKFINEEQLYDISAGKFINPRRQQTGPQNAILADLNSGQKPQMIYEKYFSSMPHDQAFETLKSMPPGEARKQLAKLLDDRWGSGN